MKLKIAVAVFIAALVMFSASDGMAQSQQPTQEEIIEMQNVEVRDSSMKEFVELHKKLQAIHSNYMKQVQAAENEGTKEELVDKANQDIQRELDRSSLSRDDYTLIVSALPYNKRLQDQYGKFME